MRKILYLSYDGLTDPLGQSQVLAYLRRIADMEHYIDIISFEKKNAYEKNKKDIKCFFKNPTLRWLPLRYHKNPPLISTIYDLYIAWRLIKKLQKEEKYDIVHCRGYVTALLGLRLKRKEGVKFIFDMRGWWADEKVESGAWQKSYFKPVYKYFKNKEKEFFQEADFSVSLTEAGANYVLENKWQVSNKIGVVPTCVDFEAFPEGNFQNPKLREELNIPQEAKVLLYSGSLGGNYPPEIVLEAFQVFQEIHSLSFLCILSKTPAQILEAALAKTSIKKEQVILRSVKYSEVHQYLKIADIGFIFYKKDFSVIGRSPTKLAEYWASGLPVISANWIGDMKNIIRLYPFGGELIENYQKEEYKIAFQKINQKEKEAQKMREAVEKFFSLKRGITFYKSIYQKICEKK